ncbi:MAG: hypothetical protein OXR84_00900, partial [Magnetovibrio sp.]|nr:hypothetical protein [Magnetovibrio sp.]
AISRIALARARLVPGDPQPAAEDAEGADGLQPLTYAKAAETAAGIDDNRLRAHTLWSIGWAQRRAGDAAGAKATESLAEKATDVIVSKLSRVWMFSEMAETHARRDEVDAAWAAFRRAVKASEIIANAWGRSRAMARLASTLIELVDPLPSRLGSQ